MLLSLMACPFADPTVGSDQATKNVTLVYSRCHQSRVGGAPCHDVKKHQRLRFLICQLRQHSPLTSGNFSPSIGAIREADQRKCLSPESSPKINSLHFPRQCVAVDSALAYLDFASSLNSLVYEAADPQRLISVGAQHLFRSYALERWPSPCSTSPYISI